jgi:hypothetical protein
MVAGHVLSFLMATALVINYEVLRGFSLKLSSFFILFIWFCVFHLELLVAYLQAYVFLTMISIYAKDLGYNRHLIRFAKTYKWFGAIFLRWYLFYVACCSRISDSVRGFFNKYKVYIFYFSSIKGYLNVLFCKFKCFFFGKK